MPCTKCGSQDHNRDNCRWPGFLLFVTFSILFLIVGPAVALEATMTEEEKAICEKNGGCMLVTKHALAKALRAAFEDGRLVCNRST